MNTEAISSGLTDSQYAMALAWKYYDWLTDNDGGISPDVLLALPESQLSREQRRLLKGYMDNFLTIRALLADRHSTTRAKKPREAEF